MDHHRLPGVGRRPEASALRNAPAPRAGRGGRASRRDLLAAALLAVGASPVRAASPGGDAGTAPARVVAAFDVLFAGPHAGLRAVHAAGLLLDAEFSPSPEAASLTRAALLAGGAIPALARFSNFAAVPGLGDGDPAASPRGLAIRLGGSDGAEWDLVTHSYDGFPAADAEEMVRFLRAVPDAAALAALAAERPAVRAFLEHPKPAPASYATEAYFGVNAFRFSNASGTVRHGRYRVVPEAGPQHLSAAEAASRAPDFLAREMAERLSRGPAGFRLLVQLAGEHDDVNDGSVPWPAERPIVELGRLSLRAVVAEPPDLTFVPTNLVGGVALSDDPMLLARTRAYRISAERRGALP